MTQEELRQIGLVQLEIMDEVHRICTKHQITYYMIAGTLLGAVRHGGFIPWDLDIDVAMPREEYERFKEACRTDLGADFRYLDHEVIDNYMRPHALISKQGTYLRMKYDHLNPAVTNLGIYLDVFPLDAAPDDPALRKKHAEDLLRLRRIKSYRLPYSYSRKAWKRYAHYAVSLLLSFVSIRTLNRRQQALMQRYRGEDSACLCSMASQYAYEKQCMPREIYGTPVLLNFEGRTYCAPAQYKEYLSRLYGDYMQLPPEEKRKANLEVYAEVKFS